MRRALNQIRKYSVRVRFAPSPTGYLHLGGLRTALYNHLFAASMGGASVLRIEDTDRTRKVDGAVEALVDTLRWSGIEYDEGPYLQSERFHIYKSEVQKLLDNGSAYKCFCTERRLNLIRREALRSGHVPKYDNKCRNLSKEDIETRLAKNEPYCIRFKLQPDIKTFEDLIYGTIAYDICLTEGDPVILKSDGYPTYHLANVVDDHYMNISHVLRGVEWQISTTKHLLMYKAFDWQPPQFGHLPLIMNSDGTKLSKRQGDARVEDHRAKGIFPNALINFITLSGGGFARCQGEGVQLYSMKELANQFQLDLINPNSSRLNPDLLKECNRLAVMENLKNDTNIEKLILSVKEMIKKEFPREKLELSDDYIRSVLEWSSGRIITLNELASPSMAFLWVLPDVDDNFDSGSVRFLRSFYQALKTNNSVLFEKSSLKTFLQEYSKENNMKFKDCMLLLRRVLCGLKEGPSVAEIMEILGKDTTMNRLDRVLVRTSADSQ